MHLRLTLVASLTAAVLAVGPVTASAGTYDYLLAPMTMCGGQKQTNTSLSTGEQELIMRCMHKYARDRTGKPRLAGNGLLQTSSDRKVRDMFRCDAFSHTACGLETLYHIKRLGYTNCRSWRAGENIAWGSGTSGRVRSIMAAWVNSTPHRTNLLNSTFRDIGVGMRKGTFRPGPNKPAYANAQVWTTHFGYRSC